MIWRAVKGIVLAVACFLVIFPFVGVISTSIAGTAQINESGGFVLFPKEVNFNAYRVIFAGGVVTRALAVSVFVTVVGTALSLAVTVLLSYALSRPTMVGRSWLLGLVLLSLLFSPGIIPSFLIVKALGLLNSVWSLILPTALNAFNVIVMRSFFMAMPAELTESARIEGASEWHILTRIVLPLSKAVLAVIGLFYAVAYWNAFFNALLYLNDSTLWPLQMVLRTYVIGNTQLSGSSINLENLPPQPALQMAILAVSIVPIACVYPFLQRHFTKGVLTGAVKG